MSKEIDKLRIEKGLKMELDLEELEFIATDDNALFNVIIDYRNIDIIRNGLNKALKREISFEYFFFWNVLVQNSYGRAKTPIWELWYFCYDMTDWIEGLAFMYEDYDRLNDDITDEEPTFDEDLKWVLRYLDFIEPTINNLDSIQQKNRNALLKFWRKNDFEYHTIDSASNLLNKARINYGNDVAEDLSLEILEIFKVDSDFKAIHNQLDKLKEQLQDRYKNKLQTIQRATLLKTFSEKNFSQDLLLKISEMIKLYVRNFGEFEAERLAGQITNIIEKYKDEATALNKIKEL